MSKCKEHITTKFADDCGIEDELEFDLHYYVNSEFYAEDKPNVLYLFDGDFDEDLITNLKYPWVQFAKDTKSKLMGVELRGRGKSKIEGHDPKTSNLFSIEHQLSDLNSIDEYNGYEFGPAPWLMVGRGYAGELAIWCSLYASSEFICALTFDVDLKNMPKYNEKSLADYNPSNIILIGSNDSKLEEYKQFVDKLKKTDSEIAVFAEKDNEQIVEKLKKFFPFKSEETL